MKKILFFLSLMLIGAPVLANETTPVVEETSNNMNTEYITNIVGKSGVLQEIYWGQTKAEVIASESTEPDFEDEQTLGYSTTYAGNPCKLIYMFFQDQLYIKAYHFDLEDNEPQDFIDDYQALKGLLIKKYGKPVSDQINWNDSSQAVDNDPRHWGKALQSGKIEFRTEWNLVFDETPNQYPETTIGLVLNNEEEEIQLIILIFNEDLYWQAKVAEEDESLNEGEDVESEDSEYEDSVDEDLQYEGSEDSFDIDNFDDAEEESSEANGTKNY